MNQLELAAFGLHRSPPATASAIAHLSLREHSTVCANDLETDGNASAPTVDTEPRSALTLDRHLGSVAVTRGAHGDGVVDDDRRVPTGFDLNFFDRRLGCGDVPQLAIALLDDSIGLELVVARRDHERACFGRLIASPAQAIDSAASALEEQLAAFEARRNGTGPLCDRRLAALRQDWKGQRSFAQVLDQSLTGFSRSVASGRVVDLIEPSAIRREFRVGRYVARDT